MAFPDFQSLMLPVLKYSADGGEHTTAEVVELCAKEFQLSDQDRKEVLASGQTRLYNRVAWAITYLKKAGLLKSAGRGLFQITERGTEILANQPASINIAFLESRFREFSEFRNVRSQVDIDEEPPATFNQDNRTWDIREGVQERIRLKLERLIPNDEVRRAALTFFAFAIENADEERSDAWNVRENEDGIRLMTGRLIACHIGTTMGVSVIGPIGDDVRAQIGADRQNDEEFNAIPSGLLLWFPIDRASVALDLLRNGLNSFIDLAMARVRQAVRLHRHVPEAVTYVSNLVSRELPQPTPAEALGSNDVDDESEEGIKPSREPRVRGRAPIFEHGQRSIASLMSDIENQVIALPDLQRPFVWEDRKVRDLLDSLFVGFPVGTLVFWHTSNEKDARALGANNPGLRASILVIDGQQRLTSLYAIYKGCEIIDKSGAPRTINIAFRPRDGRFEVTDAAIRNDPEFLANISELWNGNRPKPQIRRDLMNALRDKGRVVDEQYEDAVERNLDRAASIVDYRFPTIDIRKTASLQQEEATEEDVAEIFVRINNQGTRLGQADFVLTLLSVFHGELRDRIEDRARIMSEKAIVGIDTQQLLRASCAVAFGRARMSAIYRYLRGIDPTTGDADPAGRLKRLSQLDEAAKECIDPLVWRDYLLRVKRAGFVSESLIASKSAIVNAYAFYIRGRKAGVQKTTLDEVIARWLFGSLLTARYSGSSDTQFEQDLARAERSKLSAVFLESDEADGFVMALNDAIGEVLTGDYWSQTLVSLLETQQSRAPAALGFRAAQIILGTRALFSDQLLQNLLDSTANSPRSSSEAHHLFPVAYLKSIGIDNRRIFNQVANLADVGWHENSTMGSQSPAKYVPRLRDQLKLDDDRWGRMCVEHALPLGWENMQYEDFLRERRRRMAEIIRVAFRQLGGEAQAAPMAPPWFLPGAETVWQRIVQTERALRAVVREVYELQFGGMAARKIEDAIPERETETLARALRARPLGGDPLNIVDYLYLGQLLPLLFSADVWPKARDRFSGKPDVKQQLQSALSQIAPVRNEIAHIREVHPDRLLRATVACNDVLELIENSSQKS